MARFLEQYISFYFLLGDLNSMSSHTDLEIGYKVVDSALVIIRKLSNMIPLTNGDSPSSICTLCESESESEVEDVDGRFAFGVSFHAVKNLPIADLIFLRNLSLKAFEMAANERGWSASFSHAKRKNTVAVTEIHRVDLSEKAVGAPAADCPAN